MAAARPASSAPIGCSAGRPLPEAGRFYSADEFDIAPLLAHPGEILELGRSCVGPDHRSRAVAQLLWRGIADYVLYHDITLMFGCASLPDVDTNKLAIPLSYLYHVHLAPPELRARALPHRYVDMRKLPADALRSQGRARRIASAHQGLSAPRRVSSATAPSWIRSSTPPMSASSSRPTG